MLLHDQHKRAQRNSWQTISNKAIAEDFYEDSVFWKQILNKGDHIHVIAEILIYFWDSKTTNTKEFERYLTGRLINKVHPNIPKPDEMRHIIAL